MYVGIAYELAIIECVLVINYNSYCYVYSNNTGPEVCILYVSVYACILRIYVYELNMFK